MTEELETLNKLQTRLKQETQWRINATKVAERRKVQIDKLKQECADLTAMLKITGAKSNYLYGEIFKAEPTFRLPKHLLE